MNDGSDGSDSSDSYVSNGSGDKDSPWLEVDILYTTPSASSVTIDLSTLPANAHVIAIRYAWENIQKACCARTEYYGWSTPCPIASCPLMGSPSMLPANPFAARIVYAADDEAGVGEARCVCIPPMKCDS